VPVTSYTMIKIAVIEDDVAIAAMYEFKLKGCGYAVRVAHNGKQGLELIEAFQPELILLDLRMPVMSGDTMLEKIRETEWGASIRVIILTNISRNEAPMNLRLLNVDRYIVKAHYTPKQVVEVVQEVLG
jgi:DNA-binding response OmpR family regulator